MQICPSCTGDEIDADVSDGSVKQCMLNSLSVIESYQHVKTGALTESGISHNLVQINST